MSTSPDAGTEQAPQTSEFPGEPPYTLTPAATIPAEIQVYKNMIPISYPEVLEIYTGYGRTPTLRSNGTRFYGPWEDIFMGYDNSYPQRGPWAKLFVWLERNGMLIAQRLPTELYMPEIAIPSAFVHFPPIIEGVHVDTFGQKTPEQLGQYSVSIRGTRRTDAVS